MRETRHWKSGNKNWLHHILSGYFADQNFFSMIFFLSSWLSYNRWEVHHVIKVWLSWWCWYFRKYNDCSMEFCHLQQNYGYSLQYTVYGYGIAKIWCILFPAHSTYVGSVDFHFNKTTQAHRRTLSHFEDWKLQAAFFIQQSTSCCSDSIGYQTEISVMGGIQ